MAFRDFFDDLVKGTFWRKVDETDFGPVKRVPRALRRYTGPRGMGSRGGKVFVNGAGHLQYGEGPAPFRAHIAFDESDPHEQDAKEGLRHMGVAPEDWGNHLLYATDEEHHAHAMAAAARTGGSPAHIERVYRDKAAEAAHQFRHHPMHHMDDLTETVEVPVGKRRAIRTEGGTIVRSPDGTPQTFEEEITEKRQVPLVPRKKNGEMRYNAGNRPLDPRDVGKVVRYWNALPPREREQDARWYEVEAKQFIREVSDASGMPFLKVAALVCAGNQAESWEKGMIMAAQHAFGDTLGAVYSGSKKGEYKKGDPRWYMPRMPEAKAKVERIMATPNDRASLVAMVQREFATDKLGDFILNMIGQGEGRAGTVDRHQLGIFGAKTKINSKGEEDYVASKHEMNYYRRCLIAAAHQVGTTPEGIQAATWVHFRRVGAAEKARKRGQPEQLIGAQGENEPNIATVRAEIARRVADAREAKVEAAHRRRKEPGEAVITRSFGSWYAETLQKARVVKNPGSRGGKGYYDRQGTWHYGERRSGKDNRTISFGFDHSHPSVATARRLGQPQYERDPWSGVKTTYHPNGVIVHEPFERRKKPRTPKKAKTPVVAKRTGKRGTATSKDYLKAAGILVGAHVVGIGGLAALGYMDERQQAKKKAQQQKQNEDYQRRSQEEKDKRRQFEKEQREQNTQTKAYSTVEEWEKGTADLRKEAHAIWERTPRGARESISSEQGVELRRLQEILKKINLLAPQGAKEVTLATLIRNAKKQQAKSFAEHYADLSQIAWIESYWKSHVEHPGSRGGHGYYDEWGNWQYGDPPQDELPANLPEYSPEEMARWRAEEEAEWQREAAHMTRDYNAEVRKYIMRTGIKRPTSAGAKGRHYRQGEYESMVPRWARNQTRGLTPDKMVDEINERWPELGLEGPDDLFAFLDEFERKRVGGYTKSFAGSQRVQSPGSRGGKGYWKNGSWHYGVAPAPSAPAAPEAPEKTQEAAQTEAAPAAPVGDKSPVGNSWVRSIARDYVRQAGIAGDLPERPYAPLDEATSRKIADIYEANKHNPADPKVQASYGALAKEIKAQYEHALGAGMRFTPWGKDSDPYKTSGEMREDVAKNRHLGFYQGGDMPDDHPLKEVDPQHGLTYNDMFRAVHDLFGHAAGGYEFGPRGEENAWIEHSRMFTPAARPAMTNETRGQNSWVNFGPHLRRQDGSIPKKGEEGYVAPAERPFAEQKAALLPAQYHTRPDIPKDPQIKKAPSSDSAPVSPEE